MRHGYRMIRRSMTGIILEAECEWGYALCIRDHVCKSSEMLRTEITELNSNDATLRHLHKDFYICPHLKLKARTEGS